jgi:hypothetical protein
MLKHKAAALAAWVGFCRRPLGPEKWLLGRLFQRPLGFVWDRAFYLTSVMNCSVGRRTFFKLANQSPSMAR